MSCEGQPQDAERDAVEELHQAVRNSVCLCSWLCFGLLDFAFAPLDPEFNPLEDSAAWFLQETRCVEGDTNQLPGAAFIADLLVPAQTGLQIRGMTG